MKPSNDPLDHGWDPTSYSYNEGVTGNIPNAFPLASFQIFGGDSVPSNALGANGDFYFRSTGAAGANTCIYHKEAGAWIGLTA